MEKPEKLYHGGSNKIEGALNPVLKQGLPDHIHEKPSVFATARIDVAALFMFPPDALASIGFEQDIAYICIWGMPEDFIKKDNGGFIYVLPNGTFEQIGKEYEWQSFVPVLPVEVQEFNSVIQGTMDCGAQVYFINDDALFDKIKADVNNRTPILRELVSENCAKKVHCESF